MLKFLKREVKFENPWFKLIEDSLEDNGEQITYSFLDKRPTVFIIPKDKDGFLYFIEEFRYPVDQVVLQFPAGMVDEDEDGLTAARRELLEETGLQSKLWKKLGEFFVAPGHENTSIELYLAEEVYFLPEKRRQERDIKAVKKFSLDEIKEKIWKNEIKCGISLAALTLFINP